MAAEKGKGQWLVGCMVTWGRVVGVTWLHAGKEACRVASRCTRHGCRGLKAAMKTLVGLSAGREERRRLGAIQRVGYMVSIQVGRDFQKLFVV